MVVRHDRVSGMKCRIKIGELQVGMPLGFDVFDSNGRLLLSRGNRIASEAQLARLIKQGVCRVSSSIRRTGCRDPGDFTAVAVPSEYFCLNHSV